VALTGCAGEVTAFAAMVFSMSLGAWLVGRGHQRRALLEAVQLRRAIATGRHREIEQHLRRELALAAAGEAVSVERQWLARAQLGGLLVAEWRLDEAREIYTTSTAKLSPHLQALAAFGRHELDILTREPDTVILDCIRSDRDACLRHIPGPYQSTVARTWAALEGLCLARMGRPREAVPLLARGLECLGLQPARVVYLFHLAQAHEQLGERQLAASSYEQAMHAFPGTRLASEAAHAATRSTPAAATTCSAGCCPSRRWRRASAARADSAVRSASSGGRLSIARRDLFVDELPRRARLVE
jgi:tetratricopeptide (TPR) repeat protein